MVTRRITYRLYPNATELSKLYQWRRLHAYLYNACIEHRRTSYQRFGKSPSYYDQQNLLPEFKECWPEYKELGSHALQATVKRVDFAYQRFFKGLGGYPKFKSIRRYSGWTYPCKSGWKALTDSKHGALRVTNLGTIRMRGQARTRGIPKTCTLFLRAGKWYASITVECNPQRHTGTGAIGIDFGVLSALSLSNGTQINAPRFSRNSGIPKLQKQLRRKKKFSRAWKRIQARVRSAHRKVAQQRQNWSHQVAAQIVSCHSLVATEKLKIKGMTKSGKSHGKRGLNRSMLDVGIDNLTQLIKYKLSETDGLFVEVPTRKVKPSQTCPNCGHQSKKSLSERTHHCDRCGYTQDRDVAAAQVMLNWALGTSVLKRGEGSSTSTHCGEAVRSWRFPSKSNCRTRKGGFKQLSSSKR